MSLMSVKELLIAGKAIIEDKDNWAQGYYAYNEAGDMLEPLEEGAICFCSIGALWKADGGYSDKVVEAEQILSSFSKRHFIVDQNDEGTHEEVMAIWDKAIASA